MSLETALPSRLAVAEVKATSNSSILAVLSADGNVEINGDPAFSGTVIFSGTEVLTGNDSTAVISLGTLGRIEVLPRTDLKLSFSTKEVNCEVRSGTIRMSVARGINGYVATPNGVVVNELGSDTRFTVSAENGSTFSAFEGNVSVKEGSVKPVVRESVFRPSLPAEAGVENHVENPSRSEVNQSLAVFLVCVGTVLAAVAGFKPPYNNSFYRVGGPFSIEMARPLPN